MTADVADCVVVGTGPAGQVAAIALAAGGVRTTAIGPPPARGLHDPRTTALLATSVTLLRALGVWRELESLATPLIGMRLVDGTGAIFRAPEILFEASELGLSAFGHNIENAALLRALDARARCTENLQIVEDDVTDLSICDDCVTVRGAHGTTVRARLVVGADGRNSLVRSSAGISAKRWQYPQSAIVARLSHSRPHAEISTEFHRRAGPLTTVPLPGLASSLVWVEHPAEVDRLLKLSPVEFGLELENHLQGCLGTLSAVRDRAAFPLSGLAADRMIGARVALVGEAAHVLPPIGAQGLNLGLRDAATLAEVVAEALAAGEDLGSADWLVKYASQRRADILTRTFAVDFFNRSLISRHFPLHLARGAALHALMWMPPFRRWVMREAMQPSWQLPRLMMEPHSAAGS